MSKQIYPNFLAEIADWRAIERLPNSHLHLHWDLTTFEIRTADLIVLHQVLEKWMQQETLSEHSHLAIGNFGIVLSEDDLIDMYDLTTLAVELLPRRTVRWVDNKISISPLGTKFVSATRFSLS
ncbi:MAG: hypothetical protein AAGD96_23410 [Chloroflexota bacterium]